MRRWAILGLFLAALAGCSKSAPIAQPCDAVGCAAGKVCDPRSGECVALVPDAGQLGCEQDRNCPALTPRCDPERRRCVACLSGVDCASGSCELETRSCAPVPDTCQSAQLLDLSSGSAVVRGDTRRAIDDMRAPCSISGTTGPDLVYTFTLNEKRRLVAVARPEEGSGLQPVLALRAECDGVEPANTLGCGFQLPGGSEARLSLDEAPPGTYFLWVDSDFDSAGAFTLEVAAEDPVPGEGCGSPLVVPPFDAEIVLTGDTSEFRNDNAGSCGGYGGADLVYEVRLDATRRLKAELTSADPGFYPVLYLRRPPCDSTASSAQLACARSSTTGAPTPSAIDIPRLEAGSYFLFVDGTVAPNLGPATSGPFSLRLSVSEPLASPQNDACAGAIPIAAPASGYGSVVVQGDTSTAVSDSAGACGGTGPDVVYQLELTQPALVTARVLPLTGSALVPALYLRAPGACESEDPAAQLACSASPGPGGIAAITTHALPPGVYPLWVDGLGGTKGSFALSIELSQAVPPPANDGCSSPTPLATGAAFTTVTGSTTGARDDATRCEFPSSPDVVYSIELGARSSLSVDAKALQGSPLRPVISLRKPGQCASNAEVDSLFCAWGDPQYTDRVVFNHPSLDPGTYFLWVDGDYGTHGPFTLRVGTGAPFGPPANDDCDASPMPKLQLGVPVAGETRGASNDAKGFCGTTDGASGEYAPDVVYQFTLAGTQSVTLTVTPDAFEGQLLRPAVYVRGPGSAACASQVRTDQKGCQLAPAFGSAAVLTLPSLAPGSYYVWVDGAGQSSGKFTLKLQ